MAESPARGVEDEAVRERSAMCRGQQRRARPSSSAITRPLSRSSCITFLAQEVIAAIAPKRIGWA